MSLLRGRSRRILVFLGLATFIQICLLFSWRKKSDLFTPLFPTPEQNDEVVEQEDGNVTAYSHIVKGEVHRYAIFPDLLLLL